MKTLATAILLSLGVVAGAQAADTNQPVTRAQVEAELAQAKAAGLVTYGEEDDVENWKTLRPRNGKTSITDGPYTESKEVVGGLFIIVADIQEESLRIASMHPAATLGEEGGWAAEIIPMDFYLAL